MVTDQKRALLFWLFSFVAIAFMGGAVYGTLQPLTPSHAQLLIVPCGLRQAGPL